MPLFSRHALTMLSLATALGSVAPALAQDMPQTPPHSSAKAQAADTQEPRTPPRLIVAISVDQFSADLFAQYREHFTHGFARLLQGAVFPQGFQSHAATETCPGHSTLLTGVHPARTGIIANNWFVPGIARKDKEVYCVEDETNPASTPDDPVVSPRHLLAPTLGDLLKQKAPGTINAAVSAKDRAAVMMSGHVTDAVYWFKGKGFTTFADRRVTPAVTAENAVIAQSVAAGDSALPVPAWCEKLNRPTMMGGFTIGTYRFPLKAGDFKGWSVGPRVDAATGDMALRMVDELHMGTDAVPDVLSVSFSATDKVGHAYGTEGVEMCIQLAQLDMTLGRLFAGLDQRGIDYEVVLSADHGGFDAPERLALQGYPTATRIDPVLTGDGLSRAISQQTGIVAPTGPLFMGGGSSGDIWIAAGLSEDQRARALAALVAMLRAHPQVAAVYTAAELEKVPVPEGNPQDWTMQQRVRASFVAGRSGDVLMMTKRGVVPGKPRPGAVATHGSPWDYDRRVPILFWRKGIMGFEQPDPVETVDIAPTLAATVHLREPKGTWDGRCLDIAGGESDSCVQ